MLAASMLHIPPVTAPESDLIRRAKEAVAGL
jgi:hypothetical protein